VRSSAVRLPKVGPTFGAALLMLCTGSAHADVIQIKIQNLAFTPAQVSAKVGDTVGWANADFVAHTATARDGAWDVMLPQIPLVLSFSKQLGQ
jgi:plastocyanin